MYRHNIEECPQYTVEDVCRCCDNSSSDNDIVALLRYLEYNEIEVEDDDY